MLQPSIESFYAYYHFVFIFFFSFFSPLTVVHSAYCVHWQKSSRRDLYSFHLHNEYFP